MEVDVIFELSIELWDMKGVGLGYIILDGDTTIRLNLKHSLTEKIEKNNERKRMAVKQTG